MNENVEGLWQQRAEARSLHIGIIGLGYVGLPLALLFLEKGFRVTGFDIDAKKVATLNAGGSYIYRIEPAEIAAALQSGFHATSDFTAIRELDAILICVPTPLGEEHTPDISYIQTTLDEIVPHLHEGQLVVLESTTYPGTTTEVVAPQIEAAGHTVARNGATGGVLVAFSPEREDPGNTQVARSAIPKVIGGMSEQASAAAAAVYGSIFTRTVVVSTPEAAEMTKLLENIYRNVNIALVNELKLLCLRMGINVWEVIDAAATKPFGFQPFYPGPGLGGHCIPVDPFYLSWRAKQFGFATRFIELAGEVNEAMPQHVVDTVAAELKTRGTELAGAKVLMLGIAYKKDVDDLRESPALVIWKKLHAAGAAVRYNDPFFARVGSGRKYDLQLESAPLTDLAAYDCVLIVTDHSSYDYPHIVAESRLVVDTRNATRGIVSPKIVRC
ncbi:MAG TPA: nucleotide sugar dehydrogenase [Acidobacteriaceae bacterium]